MEGVYIEFSKRKSRSMKTGDRSLVTWMMGLFAIIFGGMTLKSGFTTLFIPETTAEAGDVVMFVLWINSILGFGYIAAGIGVLLGKPWAKRFSMGIAVITLLTYAAFGVNILLGGIWKMKTVKAMAIRTLVWIGIAYHVASLEKRNKQKEEVRT